MSEVRWCVEEADTGLSVAEGSAPNVEDAAREAAHYAMQYAQDGPVRFWGRQKRKTVFSGEMSRLEFITKAAPALAGEDKPT